MLTTNLFAFAQGVDITFDEKQLKQLLPQNTDVGYFDSKYINEFCLWTNGIFDADDKSLTRVDVDCSTCPNGLAPATAKSFSTDINSNGLAAKDQNNTVALPDTNAQDFKQIMSFHHPDALLFLEV